MADSLGTIYAELRLRLDQFKQDIQTASTEIKDLKNNVSDNMSAMSTVGGAMKDVGKSMSKYVTAPIVAAGTASVYMFTQFEEAMSQVKAVGDMTGDQLKSMTDLAMEMGAKTKFSALESANAMYELTKLGFDANEMMTALPATMDLAAAGDVGLAEASVIVAQSMNMFGESASQTTRYADVFAKAAAMGALDVTTLGDALSYAGPSAAAMGYSLEDTSAALAVFSDAGIDGTRAGHTFEALMRDMKKNAMANGGALTFLGKAGEEVAISMYDVNDKIRPLVDIVRDLETATEGMTDAQRDAALSHVANTQGLRGLNVLLSKGADYLQTYTDEIYNSSGAGDEMARIMQDNLAGSLEQLGGALETAGIALGEVLAPVIRDIADGIKVLVEWFVALSPTGKKVVVIVAAIAAAIGPLLVVFGKILTAIPMMVKGWAVLKGAMTVVMLPAIEIVAIIAAIIAIGVLLYKNWDKIKEFAGNLWEGIKSGWTAMVEGIKNLFTGIGEFFVGVWDKISTTFSDGVTAVVNWFKSLPEKIGTALSTLWTKITETFNKVVEYLAGLPAKIGAFLYTFFTETLPSWIGFGIGTMVRLVWEGIQAVIKFFMELPGKIVTFLTTLYKNITTWATNVWTTMTTWISQAVTDVVNFFATLPERVWTWLVETVNKLIAWGKQAWTTATTWVSKMITDVVAFIAGLPAKIQTWLTQVITNIQTWGTNLRTNAKNAATQLWNGFIDVIKSLPQKVSDIFWDVVNVIKDFGGKLWDSAKSIASNLWEGFKDGLGIHSPSYIEEAMKNILTKSGAMVSDMKSTFSSLNQMRVNPPALTDVANAMNTAFTDLSGKLTPTMTLAYAGLPTAPLNTLGINGVQKQEVTHVHTGVLELRGTNDEGQFVDAVRVVMDELRREVRT